MRAALRIGLATALLAAGLVASVLNASDATAITLAPGVSGPTQRVTIGASTEELLVPLAVDHLYPGSTAVQRFRLHLAGPVLSGRPAALIDNVRDQERGCVHPESAWGDITCGDGDDQGELSSQLLVGVTWHPLSADDCDGALATEPVTALRDLAAVTLAPKDTVATDQTDTCVTVTLELPHSADNLVQTDAASFDLRLGLLDAVHADELGTFTGGSATTGGFTDDTTGDQADNPSRESTPGNFGSAASGQGGAAALPFTGLALLPYLLIGLGLLQLGLLLAHVRQGARHAAALT